MTNNADMAGELKVVAIRGAIDVITDTPADIGRAVATLVEQINARNRIDENAIISAQFTMTPDLTSAFPAASARQTGWPNVPMLCATEIDVPGALGRCIRVLVHAYAPAVRKPEHVYLGAAVRLRPDLHVAGSGAPD